MKINTCIKKFNEGIGKVVPPKKTVKIVLGKFKAMDKPILKRYCYGIKSSLPKIPLYSIFGTEHYKEITGRDFVSGKGHIKEQALASGLMELVERYSCFKHLKTKWFLATFNDFKNNAFSLEDFYSNCIDGDRNKFMLRLGKKINAWPIRWYKAYTMDGDKINLPMRLIYNLIEGSNGMASGNSLEEALLHGICEVVERHCETLIETQKLKTPTIELSTINSRIAQSLIKKLKIHNRKIIIKDCSLGFGIPVMGCIRELYKNKFLICFGAATTKEEAVIRALTENAQCENNVSVYKNYGAIKHFLANKMNISFKNIPNEIANKNILIELKNINKILNRNKMRVFFIDATDKVLDIHSVIVYIRGAKYSYKMIPGANFPNALDALCKEFYVTKNYSALYCHLKKMCYEDKDYSHAIRYLLKLLTKTEKIKNKENKIISMLKKAMLKLSKETLVKITP